MYVPSPLLVCFYVSKCEGVCVCVCVTQEPECFSQVACFLLAPAEDLRSFTRRKAASPLMHSVVVQVRRVAHLTFHKALYDLLPTNSNWL